MKQDVSPNETVDELKKKVLELYDVIDKQNDYIKKYQAALEIASVDIVKTILKRDYKVIDDHREEWENVMVKERIY